MCVADPTLLHRTLQTMTVTTISSQSQYQDIVRSVLALSSLSLTSRRTAQVQRPLRDRVHRALGGTLVSPFLAPRCSERADGRTTTARPSRLSSTTTRRSSRLSSSTASTSATSWCVPLPLGPSLVCISLTIVYAPQDVAMDSGVKLAPAFHFYKDGAKVGE